MSRINAILVLILAFSSICFGATLMQMSMLRSGAGGKKPTTSLHMSLSELSCEQLIKEHKTTMLAKVAEELYKEAFSLSFNGDWPAAQIASECASHLVNGSRRWDIEAKDLIN